MHFFINRCIRFDIFLKILHPASYKQAETDNNISIGKSKITLKMKVINMVINIYFSDIVEKPAAL